MVLSAEGQLHLDGNKRLPGRGAYLCPSLESVQRALKRKCLDRALRQPVPAASLAALQAALVERVTQLR